MKKIIIIFFGLVFFITGIVTPIQASGDTPLFELDEGETIVDFSAGGSHLSVLTSKLDFWMMGTNYDGQLGSGVTDAGSATPLLKNDLFTLAAGDVIVEVENGLNQSAIITAAGRVFVWGRNSTYNLGDGSDTLRSAPVEITSHFGLTSPDRMDQIAFGYEHTIAVSELGKVFVWGRNNDYQLGYNAPNNYSAIPHDITNQFSLNPGEKILSVAAGGYHSGALTSNNRLFLWGNDNY